MTLPSRYQAVGARSSRPWSQIVNAILGGSVIIAIIFVVFFTRAKIYHLEEGELDSWLQVLTIGLIISCIITILAGFDFIYLERGQGLKLVLYMMGITSLIAVLVGCSVLIAAQNTEASKGLIRLDHTNYDWFNNRSPSTNEWNVFQSNYRCCGLNDPSDWYLRQPIGHKQPDSFEADKLGHGPEPVPIPPRYGSNPSDQQQPPRYGTKPIPMPPSRYGPEAVPPRYGPEPVPTRYGSETGPLAPNRYPPRQDGPQPIPPSQQKIPPSFPQQSLHPAPFPQNQYSTNNVMPPSCCRHESCSPNSICYCETNSPSLFRIGCKPLINRLKHSLDYMAALLILLGLGLAALLIVYTQLCIVDVTEISNLRVVETGPKPSEQETRDSTDQDSNDHAPIGFKAMPR